MTARQIATWFPPMRGFGSSQAISAAPGYRSLSSKRHDFENSAGERPCLLKSKKMLLIDCLPRTWCRMRFYGPANAAGIPALLLSMLLKGGCGYEDL